MTTTVYVRATDYSRNIYHTDPECPNRDQAAGGVLPDA